MKTGNLLKILVLGLGFAFLTTTAQAALTDTWTYQSNNGTGGFDPARYGGNFTPNPLLPDAGSTGGGNIALTNFTSGGIGSSGYSSGYGGFLTLFSSAIVFEYQTGTILSGLDTITLSFKVGGGADGMTPNPITYNGTAIRLNYNSGNQGVASSSFSSVYVGEEPTPVMGNQSMTLYTWTWDNLDDIGPLTDFSFSWNVAGKNFVFFNQINITQIPEPTAVALVIAGGVALVLRCRRRPSASR